MNALALPKSHVQIEVQIFQIASQMKDAGLSDEFISNAIRTAIDYEGVADLVFMWSTETDSDERNEIVADIQELVDDCSQHKKIEAPAIRFNDLEAIAKNIRAYKDALLEIVIKQGGINHLAELTGIPQPSLSRFFNSNSMPHRGTLLKIGNALKLDAVQLASKWVIK